MSDGADREHDLERRVGQALRALPLRRAPASLEARVLRELGRRTSIPWWRQSFSGWPRTAQAGLAVICSAIVAAIIAAPWADGGVLARGGAFAAVSPLLLHWARPALTLLSAARALDASLVRAIPLYWLYGAAAAAALLYAALFALGATAYRTLYLKNPSGELTS